MLSRLALSPDSSRATKLSQLPQQHLRSFASEPLQQGQEPCLPIDLATVRKFLPESPPPEFFTPSSPVSPSAAPVPPVLVTTTSATTQTAFDPCDQAWQDETLAQLLTEHLPISSSASPMSEAPTSAASPRPSSPEPDLDWEVIDKI